MLGRFLRIHLAALAFLAVCAPGAGASVLYIGDSLGVGTEPYLRERLDEAVQADVVGGRPSADGVETLAANITPEHEVVVFDLGTNDGIPETYAESLAAVRQIVGDRCIVVATLNRPPVNGYPIGPIERVLERFVASDANVEVADWRSLAQQQPNLLIDGIHATGEGYSLRAALLADAIQNCLTFGTVSSDGGGDGLGLGLGGGQGGGAGHAAKPEPQPEPRPRPQPKRPLEVVAGELAKAVAVGAEFG